MRFRDWYTVTLITSALFCGNAAVAYQCPSDRNEEEVKSVLANLDKYEKVKVIRRSDWLPPCCQSSQRSQDGCGKIAKTYLKYADEIGNGIKKPDGKGPEVLGQMIANPVLFWDKLCEPDRQGAGVNNGVQKTYSNGVITVHDQAIPTGSQYLKEMDAMAILLRTPNNPDHNLEDLNKPYTKDRKEMLSALYFDRVAQNWAYVGYHFCVGRFSGATFEGRDLGLVGAHVQQLNNRNIGICMLGNTQQHDMPGAESDPKYNLPQRQIDTMVALLRGLGHQFQIDPKTHVVTHNYLQCKACCLACNRWLSDLTGNKELLKPLTSDGLNPLASDTKDATGARLDYFREFSKPRPDATACLSPDFRNDYGTQEDRQIQSSGVAR